MSAKKEIPKMQYRVTARAERGAYVQVETHFPGEAVRVANAFWALLMGVRGEAIKRFSLSDLDDERTEIRHENNKRTFLGGNQEAGERQWQPRKW